MTQFDFDPLYLSLQSKYRQKTPVQVRKEAIKITGKNLCSSTIKKDCIFLMAKHMKGEL